MIHTWQTKAGVGITAFILAAAGGAAWARYAPPTLPARFTASVTEVGFWKRPTVVYGVGTPSMDPVTKFYGDDAVNDPPNYCPGNDAADGGLQKLQLTVTRPDGTSSSMSVLKRRR